MREDIHYAALYEFVTAFDMKRDPELWTTLIREEFRELTEAFVIYASSDTDERAAELLKEACDVAYVVTGFDLLHPERAPDIDDDILQAIAEALDAVTRLFTDDQRIAAFKAVHASNMSKLGDDGKPVRRDDGKVLKGPNYKPADILHIITG